ncbi:MAG: hypothetical protein FWD17_12380 [Polyangiaceae bacterium]|nr:hypothetical protein [Polyangiaceae bacterium]
MPSEPAAPPKANRQPSIADTFERLLVAEDIDASFATLEATIDPTDFGSPEPAAVAATDLAEVSALFAQLAANHVRPVRDFVLDLRWSDATADWLAICRPALQSLRRAAEKLDLRDVCRALEQVSAALDNALLSGNTSVAGTHREAILARYDELAQIMPEAFALDLDRTQRESIILRSLLLQVPGVKKITLDKMYAAGLSTLEAMLVATPADIATTIGIPDALAGQIIERFRAYRDQVKATVPDAERTHERERLESLVGVLRQQNEAYERASQSWTREADENRKTLRKARAQTMLDIQVELARLGEVDRVANLEKLPFEAKVAALEAFLEEARSTLTLPQS